MGQGFDMTHPVLLLIDFETSILSFALLLHLWLLLFLLINYLVYTCRQQFPLSFEAHVGEASSWSRSAISLFAVSLN